VHLVKIGEIVFYKVEIFLNYQIIYYFFSGGSLPKTPISGKGTFKKHVRPKFPLYNDNEKSFF